MSALLLAAREAWNLFRGEYYKTCEFRSINPKDGKLIHVSLHLMSLKRWRNRDRKFYAEYGYVVIGDLIAATQIKIT